MQALDLESRLKSVRWLALLACLLAWLLMASAASAQNVLLTILDGDAVVIDGAKRLVAQPGLRLGPGNIIDTGPGTALVRLEWPDQSVVDLGAATRVMIAPPGFAARSGRLPMLYLLQGWAKVTGHAKEPTGGVVTPAIELLPLIGAAVVYSDKRERFAFAESGPLEVIERGTGGGHAGVAQGALYSSGGVVARPPADWLARVPRTFRDPLPLRAAVFKDRLVNASVLPAPSYVILADWLSAEPAVRHDFPRRFFALAQDPAFRQALQSHLSAHPEWGRILNPPRPQ